MLLFYTIDVDLTMTQGIRFGFGMPSDSISLLLNRIWQLRHAMSMQCQSLSASQTSGAWISLTQWNSWTGAWIGFLDASDKRNAFWFLFWCPCFWWLVPLFLMAVFVCITNHISWLVCRFGFVAFARIDIIDAAGARCWFPYNYRKLCNLVNVAHTQWRAANPSPLLGHDFDFYII